MKFDSEKEQFEYEERAAIMQYDGGLTKEDAENEAYIETIKKRNNTSLYMGYYNDKTGWGTVQEISSNARMI